MEKQRVIFYRDELNDEFSTAQITPKRIDGSYRYCHDSLWKRFTHFFWYRMVATPIAYGYVKTALGQKTVGREKLKPYRKAGYFLYGNHTQIVGDAFLPSILTLPKTCYTIVHPDNVSMPLLGRVTPSMGALPLPDDMDAYRNFLRAVDRRIDEGHAVVIYPEAHIWPFYTEIRPFPDDSFHYPVKKNVPCFCFTNTYQKRRWSKKPKIVTYIDGPFFPDISLPKREQRAALRDRVYEAMQQRAKSSTVKWIRYEKEKNNG